MTPERRQGDLRLATDTAKAKSDTRVMSEQSATFHRRQIRMVADITEKKKKKNNNVKAIYGIVHTATNTMNIQLPAAVDALMNFCWTSIHAAHW